MTDSFIVDFWRRLFHVLRYVSVFQYVRLIPGLRGSHFFVEAWVVGNLAFALVCMVLLQIGVVPSWAAWLMLGYSFTRILEITVYQVNVLLFDPYQSANYHVKSYRRLVVLLIHNYVEVIFWFAVSYMVLSSEIGVVVSQGNMLDTLLFSFVTMVTFGSGSLADFKDVARTIIFVQAIIGLFMTIISLARFIGLLPKPVSQDSSEHDVDLQLDLLRKEVAELRRQVNSSGSQKKQKNRGKKAGSVR
ncbi:hypothetical protein JOC95_000364 [Bacillus tianshenii]|uniref:Potassium channel domain-containing protein n=1 Tax=Sutcliffiella tianshenii TaxID=1463404 RepID=A0ABS2NV28_9BACI|nr:ion channel [Bacillus tianshenii]MBM7618522.1 hypothetical protein [Bacillus tianshenii]